MGELSRKTKNKSGGKQQSGWPVLERTLVIASITVDRKTRNISCTWTTVTVTTARDEYTTRPEPGRRTIHHH